jgi:hypothetical protein
VRGSRTQRSLIQEYVLVLILRGPSVQYCLADRHVSHSFFSDIQMSVHHRAVFQVGARSLDPGPSQQQEGHAPNTIATVGLTVFTQEDKTAQEK